MGTLVASLAALTMARAAATPSDDVARDHWGRPRSPAIRVTLATAMARADVEAAKWERGCDTYVYGTHTRRGQLERLTRPSRMRRARAHMGSARAARQELRRPGGATPGVDWARRAEWHEARARGQQERYRRLQGCGSRVRAVTCHSCDDRRYVPQGCGLVRECAACRERRARSARARFARARDVMLSRIVHRGLDHPRQPGGRWSERHFTLTVPGRGLTTRQRVVVLFESWSRFVRWLTRWCRAHERRGLRPVYYRAFEATPGSDGWGHPHLHVWHLGPYLDHCAVRMAWTRALASASHTLGIELDGEPIDPYVTTCKAQFHEHKGRRSIRLEHSDGTFVDYLESWTIGEADKRGRWMRVDAEAQLYDVLINRRLSQGSRGFLALAAVAMQCHRCGATHVLIGAVVAPVYWCRILSPEETRALAARQGAALGGSESRVQSA